MLLQDQLCVRCGRTTAGIRIGGSTCMRWPVGVDYLDQPEPDNHFLWICSPCWERKGVELYWPAFGFESSELEDLQAKYDANFRRRYRITLTGWLN